MDLEHPKTTYPRSKNSPYYWTQKQKKTLKTLYHKYQGDWNIIMTFLPGRSAVGCEYMAQRLKIKVRDPTRCKRFTDIQDKILIRMYKKYPENWQKILEGFSNRTIIAIKRRYCILNCLTLNKSIRSWTNQEDEHLFKLIYVLQYRWNLISNEFMNCTADHCYQRFKYIVNRNQFLKWKKQEDDQLLMLFESLNQNWLEISKLMVKKSAENCMIRFFKLKIQNSQIEWQEVQIKKLLNQHKRYSGDWNQISKQFNKNLRQCYFQYYELKDKQRFYYQKNSKIKISNDIWNFQQDDILLKLVQQHLADWQIISSMFKTKRTSQECKKRFFILQYIYENKQDRIWKQEEDKLLIQKFEQKPFDWAIISKQFIKCTKYQTYLRLGQLMQKDETLKKYIYDKYCQKIQDIEQIPILKLKDRCQQNKESVQIQLDKVYIDRVTQNVLVQLQMMIDIWQNMI